MKNIALLAFAILTIVSCDKKTESAATENGKPASTEVNQVQEPLKIKNDKGEEVTVVYFGEGDQVAVKIQKSDGEEQKLSARTTNGSGNPIFANDDYMWEMTMEGKGGKLTSKSGEVEEYK
ncbi:hypothetical protein [Chryseobacterium sp. MP_3.2]|uniref:hypothetical protein n=1 Tax=Chryseobacterium sp. MP_3.2 TaxID=3071712 RepID=UPI002DFE2F95|nr:hypothetical protein [Chryseobacterium sp. MP_3.2]